jgi:lysylphosphatidylglycerol synthetase-like protein (DUF2156 family)
MGDWYVRPVVLGVAVVSLVSPRILRHPYTWLAVASLTAWRIAADWPLADNHIYLLAYWCLAAAIGLRKGQPAASLADSGRYLIGLAFACAVIWKLILSPDFVDGRFFRVTLLTDPRLVAAAQLVGGLTDAQVAANRQALEPLPEGAERLEPLPIVESARLRAFAIAGTWGVLLLEAAVAGFMLLPARPAIEAARHAALLTFCFTTYAFAPVAGFGWLLLVMGAVQVRSSQRWLRNVYVGAFVVVLFYTEVPWSEMVLDLMRRI